MKCTVTIVKPSDILISALDVSTVLQAIYIVPDNLCFCCGSFLEKLYDFRYYLETQVES